MSEPTTSPHQQDMILKARQASLLKIFVSGKRRLTAGELGELEGILPARVLRRQPIERARYDHPIEHYCATFERSVRNLKGWIADGRDADPPRMPPFDAPAQMLAWWHAVKSNRPPDVLIRLAAAGGRVTTAPPDPATLPPLPVAATPAASPAAGPLFEAAAAAPSPRATSTSAAPTEPATGSTPHTYPLPGGPAIGFSASLARQRIAEAKAGELHNSLVQQAILATDPEMKLRLQAAADQAYRSWSALTTEMRRAEAEAPKILAAAAKNWNADDVVAAIHELHVPMRDSIRALARRVRPLLADLSAPEAEALWDREVEKLFAGWRRNKFVGLALPAPDADGA